MSLKSFTPEKVSNNILESLLKSENVIIFNFVLFLAFSLFGTGPSWQAKSDDYYEAESSNLINQLIFTFLFISSLYAVRADFEQIFRFIKKEKYLTLFIAFCLISAVWSDYSLISIKRSFQLFVSVFVIMISIVFIERQKLLRIIKVLISIYAFTTLISVVLIPDAIDPAFGTWRGIERQKNGLAQVSLLCFLFSLLFMEENNSFSGKLYNYSLSIIFAFIIIMAQSSTIIIVFSLVLIVTLILKIEKIFRPLRMKRFFFLTVLSFIIILILVLGSFSTEVFAIVTDLFQKDLTFTGRTVFWAYLWDQIMGNFLFGFGYGTFWVMGSPQVNALFYFEELVMNTSHSGFIDLGLQLGVTGFSLFIILVISFFRRALSLHDNFALLTVISILIANITETTLFTSKGLTNFVFIFFYLNLSSKYFKIKLNDEFNIQ